MKTYTLVLGVAALLIAGEVVRRAADVEERLGDAERQFVLGATTPASTTALDAATDRLARVPMLGTRVERATRRHQAALAYWNTDYDLVRSLADAPDGEPDSELRLLDANASFREALLRHRAPPALASALEDVLRRYAAVIEVDPESTTAAYNYEFVARLRAALSGTRGASTPALERQNLHGDQGQPPADGRKTDFNVIVPLRPEERQDQMTPGTGAIFQRKG